MDKNVIELLGKPSAAVEASAGTGKTYRIKEIVLQCVLDGTPIERFLLVTFTEKAAGELRDRIRATLQEALGKEPDPDKRVLLKHAVEAFDTAAISTIHSFCQSVLKEFAFENRMPMTTAVQNDFKSFAESAVRETLRTTFAEAAGVLDEKSRTAAVTVLAGTKGLESIVASIAREVCAWRGEDLDLLDDVDFTQSVDGNPFEAVKDKFAALHPELKPIQKYHTEKNRESYDALAKVFAEVCAECKAEGMQPAEKAAELGLKKQKPMQLFEILGELTDADSVQAKIKDIFSKAASSEDRFEEFKANPPLKKGFTTFPFPQYEGIFDLLIAIRDENSRIAKENAEAEAENNSLSAEEAAANLTIAKALRTYIFRKALELFKQTVADCGDITFDSMVLSLKRALDDKTIRQRVVDSLKSKYDIAVIDEFQDTDAVQWDIFKSVFTGDPGKKLIVVGDPKQAIYSFRSADLETYKFARDVLNEPWPVNDTEPNPALNLPVAWRSTKELVNVFNSVFGSEQWFGKTAEGESQDIVYNPVEYPGEPNVRSNGDGTGLSAVTLIDIEKPEDVQRSDVNACRAELARRAVKYIEETVGRCVGQEYVKDGKSAEWMDKVLGYGDYCILVKTRADAQPYIKELRKKGIPSFFYKEPGLQSDSAEIEAVALMLTFLSNPRDRAAMNGVLISDFFARDLTAVADGDGLEDRELGEFLNLARRFILKRQWERLFDWLLNGARLAANCFAAPYGARRFEAYRQIFDSLLTTRTRRAESLTDFMEIVNTWRAGGDKSVENETYRRRDLDAARVQIMTMHASKGLEFPVVIIGSGMSNIVSNRRDPQAFPCRQADGTIRRRSAVDFSDEFKDQYKAHCIAEAKRLYYVALTRAKYKIIMPGEVHSCEKDSPLTRFVKPAFLAYRSESLGAAVAKKDEAKKKEESEANKTADVEVFNLAYLKNNRLRVDSFSGLNGSASSHGKDDERDPVEFEEMAQAALPPGAKSGTVFHEVMERLCKNAAAPDFRSVGAHATEEALFADAVFMDLVKRAMESNRLKDRDEANQTTQREIARIVWNVLRTEFTLSDGSRMRLRDVEFAQRRAEIEFYAPESKLLRDIGDKSCGDNLMNGFIDLVFEHDGRFYILDWKTNFLGAYDAESVRAEMEHAGYLNQFKIYWLSFVRRLETCFGDGAASRIGGTVYLFVRGVGRGAPGDGVFTERCDLDEYAKEIGKLVSKGDKKDGAEE